MIKILLLILCCYAFVSIVMFFMFIASDWEGFCGHFNEDERKVKILDNDFIKRNNYKYNGSIIYNNSEFELKEYFEAHDKMNKDTFKLLICLDKNIEDISYIFWNVDL